MKYELQIEIAWLKLALNEYLTEFKRVYDCIFNFEPKEDKKIKELYGAESYVFLNSDSLSNIKEKYLNKFDLTMPENPIVKRYAKFLFDNF